MFAGESKAADEIRGYNSHRQDVLLLVRQDRVDFLDVLVGLVLDFFLSVLQISSVIWPSF